MIKITHKSTVATGVFQGCGCLFFGFFFCGGLFGVVILLAFVIVPMWQVQKLFVETQGEIVQGRIREELHETASYYPEVLIRYTPAGGRQLENWGYRSPEMSLSWHPDAWEVLDRYPVGQRLTCWYHPHDPNRVVIDRAIDWPMLMLLIIPLVFVGIGLWGMKNARGSRSGGLSPEAQAVAARKAGGDATAARILIPLGALFLLVGLGALYGIVAGQILPERRAANHYVETTCEIVDSRMLTMRGDDSTSYRPEFKIRYKTPAFPDPTETWTYRITNTSSSNHDAEQAILERFQKGKQYPCWYDPERPRWVVLDRTTSWFPWIMLLLPALFLGVGGIMLAGGLRMRPKRSMFAGLSAEDAVDPFAAQAGNWQSTTGETARPAWQAPRSTDTIETEVFAEKDSAPDLRTPAGREALRRRFPNVPEIDLSKNPGEALRYRLPVGTSHWGQAIALGCGALFWNAITGVFVGIAVTSHINGKAEWFLTIFILPFVAVGLGLIFFTFKQLLVAWGVHPTTVEISDHPFTAGGRYAIYLAQPGPLTVNSLVVTLTCEEAATYRQGTSSQTDTARICHLEIFRREGFEIESGLPMTAKCEIAVPGDAMHSLTSGHNEIRWKLLVKGDIARWPDFEVEFPVVVRPAPRVEESRASVD